MAATLALSLRLAWRELRAGIRGFRVFLACLAIGVGAIAAVGSIAGAIEDGLADQARVMLGGDVDLRLSMRPAADAERAYLAAAGRLSTTVEMHAMAQSGPQATPALVHLKAIDGAYPLFGAVELKPEMPLATALAVRDGIPGAVAEASLMGRLGVTLGDTLRVGDATFELRATLVSEPDRLAIGVGFGPRLMIGSSALDATGLVQPGSLVRYHYRLALAPGTDVGRWVEALGRDLPHAGWRARDTREPQPRLDRWLRHLTTLLSLVGLATLLIGGLGVGGATRAYLEAKTETIATLKCLGASRRTIVGVYLAEVLGLAAAGIALGLVFGALAPILAGQLIGAFLPIELALAVHPAPLGRAALLGLLATLVFAVWPLARAGEVPAASLFRDLVAPERSRPSRGVLALIAGLALALAGLAIASVDDHGFAVWFVLGVGFALVVLRAAASGLTRLAGAVPRPRRPRLRLALANLHRPGATTANVVVALGMGVTLLVAVALVAGNITRMIDRRLAEDAPAFFFLDIQPDQAAAFDATVAAIAGDGRVRRVPHLRGRITRIDGVAVEDAEIHPSAAWATSSDRGVTYAAAQPPGSRIVEGDWWPADYAGPPLISFDARLAGGLGVTVGDTLTINVLGRDITAEIANTRVIDWSTLGINFAIVFAPGALEGAPQTYLATVHAAPADEDALARAVVERFPNVSVVGLRELLDGVRRVIGQLGAAARAVAAVTLATSVLVVAGAVAAGQRRRVYDAVVLKVLGATRGDVAKVYLAEFALVGVTAGLLAAGLGTLAGYLVVTRVLHAEWHFLPGAVALNATLCLVLALVIGFAGTWSALGRSTAAVLRHA